MGLGYTEKLPSSTVGLERTLGMDAELIACISLKAQRRGAIEQGESEEKVGARCGLHLVTRCLSCGIDISKKNISTLNEPSDARDLTDTAEIACCEQHACMPRVRRKNGHAPSELGQRPVSRKCA